MKTLNKTQEKSPSELLETIALLQQQLLEKDNTLNQKNEIIKSKDTLIENLEYRLTLALRYRYASRKEALETDHPQRSLFNEAELSFPEETQEVTEVQTVTVNTHTRKKTGRKPLPQDLPRIRREYDLTDAEKQCICGSHLQVIGEDISEQLEIIPAQMFVIEHVKKKYACKACSDTIKSAAAPKQAIPKSIAGPGLLAHILVSKFCDHLPLYRQETILKRIGIEITRASLCNWVTRCGELVAPLIALMQHNINCYDVAYSDETVLQVLKESGRQPTQKSYMWLFGGGAPSQFCWVYQYHPGRATPIPQHFFEDFTGFIHVDGYAGYHELTTQAISLVGCMAHARRKFFEITQATTKKKGLAHWAIAHIAKLYAIEKHAKASHLTTDEIYNLRQEKSKPLLDEFKVWLDGNLRHVPPKSPIGKAIQYSLNQWHKLVTYLNDGRLEIDNNRAERSIKPFVIGRKNWLFSDTSRGAHASANMFSLIETCKEHRIEPYAYLRYVLTQIPNAKSTQELEQLLPYRCDSAVLAKQWQNVSDEIATGS
jgi:transposase